MNKALSIWHLHDVYSLDEAAWLIVGESPLDGCEDKATYSIYRGVYGALKKSIYDFGGNMLKVKVAGIPIEDCPRDPFSSEPEMFQGELRLNELASVTISKTDLVQWLDHKKHYPPFFFPEKSGEAAPTEKENIHVSPDPVATLASDDLPSYLSERLSLFSSHIRDAYKLRLANPKANKATLIDLMCEELGVKDLEARQIDVMIRPPKGK